MPDGTATPQLTSPRTVTESPAGWSLSAPATPQLIPTVSNGTQNVRETVSVSLS